MKKPTPPRRLSQDAFNDLLDDLVQGTIKQLTDAPATPYTPTLHLFLGDTQRALPLADVTPAAIDALGRQLKSKRQPAPDAAFVIFPSSDLDGRDILVVHGAADPTRHNAAEILLDRHDGGRFTPAGTRAWHHPSTFSPHLANNLAVRLLSALAA